MPYPPIENHGLVGNMATAALVASDGSVDWMCWPRFDSPSVFAAILDDAKGGRFRIAPVDPVRAHRQFYWPDTNVLHTRFFTAEGSADVVDYMPVGLPEDHPGRGTLIREVRGLRGSVPFRLECRPAFDFARTPHELSIGDSRATFTSPPSSLSLWGTEPLSAAGDAAVAQFSVGERESATFILGDGAAPPRRFSRAELDGLLRSTLEYWHGWLSKCTYTGRWRERIYRSALVLKLLTFEQTGAIIAAPTCGLPEEIGGVRNWDYRFTWIRDAAFTLYALMRIGFTEEAAAFMRWIDARCRDAADGGLQVMYGLDGRRDLTETELGHLDGYRGSRPVRIGNGAFDQEQLDIYGELIDAVHMYDLHGSPISYDLWVHLRRLIDRLVDRWERPDAGIWEVRGPLQHFVFSKLMCWTAFDRGLKIADRRSFPCDRARWVAVRDRIYESIMANGWNPKARSFVQAYGSDALDASILLMPMVGFIAADDPRMRSTLSALHRPPAMGGLVSESFVYRYDRARTDDGLPGTEGSFNLCSFWLIEALARAGREDRESLQQARFMFEEMLGYANPLGLFAEQTGPNGEMLGNFPQALTHLSLISAALRLDRALGPRQADQG